MNLRTRLAHLRSAMDRREKSSSVGARTPPRLSTPADILKLLEEAAAVLQSDPFAEPAAKARAMGHLAAVALKAIETNNLAARVALLEMVLKQRPKGEKQ